MFRGSESVFTKSVAVQRIPMRFKEMIIKIIKIKNKENI